MAKSGENWPVWTKPPKAWEKQNKSWTDKTGNDRIINKLTITSHGTTDYGKAARPPQEYQPIGSLTDFMVWRIAPSWAAPQATCWGYGGIAYRR